MRSRLLGDVVTRKIFGPVSEAVMGYEKIA